MSITERAKDMGVEDLVKENKRLKRNWEEEIEACMGWWKKAKDLEEENKKLKEENERLKSDLGNIQCEFGFECDECEYWKREIKKHKPCLIKDEYVFNLGDYDYQILTSTTPQLKIIKKNNKGLSSFTVK